MRIIAWDQESDTAVEPERAPNIGEWCCRINEGRARRKSQFWPEPVRDESIAERVWRDAQLEKTDKFVMLEDYPGKESLIRYRELLRDYPSSQDFPNGVRPAKPENIK